jgi:hypothetical protein
LNLATPGTISDVAGNALSTSTFSGQTYTYNTSAPVITGLGTATTFTGPGATSFTTNSYGPTASGSVVLVFVTAHEMSASPSLSVSGGPTTGGFTSIASSIFQTGMMDGSIVEAFWAKGAGGATTGALTITSGPGKNIDGAVVHVVQITGASTTNPIVTTVVATPAPGTNASVTFPPPASSTDGQILLTATQVSTTWTKPGPFTLLFTSAESAGGPMGMGSAETQGDFFTTSPSAGSVSATAAAMGKWGAIGIEVN